MAKPDKHKLTRTALFFEADSLEKLNLLSDATGAPIAELVRRGMKQYLESRRADWEPLAKAAAAGKR